MHLAFEPVIEALLDFTFEPGLILVTVHAMGESEDFLLQIDWVVARMFAQLVALPKLIYTPKVLTFYCTLRSFNCWTITKLYKDPVCTIWKVFWVFALRIDRGNEAFIILCIVLETSTIHVSL